MIAHKICALHKIWAVIIAQGTRFVDCDGRLSYSDTVFSLLSLEIPNLNKSK